MKCHIPAALGAILLALAFAGPASAMVMTATFDTNYTGAEQACAQAAINQWQSTITSATTFANSVRVRIVDLGTTGILASTTIESGGYSALMVEGEWLPTPPGGGGGGGGGSAVTPWDISTFVTIDLNSERVDAGDFSFVGPSDPVVGGKYDALTIFRHELCHAVGFSATYTDFAAKVTPVPDPYRTYTGTGNSFTVELTGAANGTHVLGNTDLMSAALGTGVRRDISSDPDLEVLMDAYGYTTPEPATLAFVAIGLASVVAARRRRRAA
jgi:hypothetical protein